MADEQAFRALAERDHVSRLLCPLQLLSAHPEIHELLDCWLFLAAMLLSMPAEDGVLPHGAPCSGCAAPL